MPKELLGTQYSKRVGFTHKGSFSIGQTGLGWTMKELFHTPKGSLFPWKECLLFNRIASFSEEV